MEDFLKLNDPRGALEHFLAKMTYTAGPVELDRLMHERKDDIVIIDVRAAEDYAAGHIPGAISLPKDKWHTMEGLRKDKVNVLYCYSIVCHLAATAACQFAKAGFKIMELDGGMETWKEYKFDVET